MPISDADAQGVTIQSYNEHINEYIEKDSSDDVRTLAYWPGVQYFLDKLQKGQEILEIGSGTGADARRIESRGFRVQRTDVAEAFLGHMRSNGCDARHFDVLEGAYGSPQHAIFANAVFLHFTQEQFRVALAHVLEILDGGGLFCMGMKLGDFEGWREKGLSGKRYFRFWELKDLQAELAKTGFRLVHSFVTPDEDFAVVTVAKKS